MTTLERLKLEFPAVDVDSLTEIEWFITGYYTHLVMKQPMTERVAQLVDQVRTDENYAQQVAVALNSLVNDEKVLTTTGVDRIKAELGMS